MKNHFAPIIYSPLTQRRINPGTFQVRLAPIVDDSTNLGKAYDPDNPDDDLNIVTTHTYGWAESDGYSWFLIEDNQDRLVWIIQSGVAFANDEDNAASRQITDPLRLSPGKLYEDNDLFTITGG